MVNPLKVGESLSRCRPANPEPSPVRWEGVETGRAVPKGSFGAYGEGTVQTTNALVGAAAEAEVV